MVSFTLLSVYPSRYDILYPFGRKLNKPSVGLDVADEKFSFGLPRNPKPAIYLKIVNFTD